MKQLLVVVGLALALAAGYWVGQRHAPAHTAPVPHAPAAVDQPSVWTCSMHPQIRLPAPGLCPICHMDLIPAEQDTTGAPGARSVSLSERARALAEVEVSPVERAFVETEIRMSGKVDFDETRVKTIAARVSGRLDRLYVDYTGVPVAKGDHLILLYSPELVTAQEELLSSLKAARELERSGATLVRDSARQTVEAAREKLLLWGLTRDQVQAIEQRGTPTDHLTIFAPISGIVITKHANEGMYVETGTPVYTIADLSHVWVRLDAYESDLAGLRYGQSVEFTTQAYPGDVFTGRITFIDPVVNAMTRTVKVRVNVTNADGRLKPEMFVSAVVHARIAADGKVIAPDLAGKWISPMHPEIIKDEPGTCDVCGMPLVRAEALGYAGGGEETKPLVIPATAPLITGKRALVYVEVPGEVGRYEGREIVLGPRAGDHYVVRDGLVEGERVVTRGNFKIDSAVQLAAKPSMMSPGSGTAPPAEEEPLPNIPAEFRRAVGALFGGYFRIHHALSRDDLASATPEAARLLDAVKAVDAGTLSAAATAAWRKEQTALQDAVLAIARARDIQRAREAFENLSNNLIVVVRRFRAETDEPLLRFHCPMAFDWRGADWLQHNHEVENPYFGATMFRCGTLQETLVAPGGRAR